MRQSKNRKTTHKLIFILVLFFCLTSAVIYFFIFSPFFRIKKIEISGNQQVATADIQDVVRRKTAGKKFWFLPKDNIFFINQQDLAASLKNSLVRLSNVLVSKYAPRRVPTLNIEIIERQIQAIVCHYYYESSLCRDALQCVSTGVDQSTPGDTPQCCVPKSSKEIFDNCFYVDQRGIAFKTAPQTQGSLILLAGVNYDIWLGAEAVKPHLIEVMAQIKKDLAEKIPDLSFDYFLIISSQEIHLKTKQGWQIYFDVNGNLSHQIDVLKQLLIKKIDKPEDLEYIDLRIEEKVYYKNRE